jgi:hypothetical protein
MWGARNFRGACTALIAVALLGGCGSGSGSEATGDSKESAETAVSQGKAPETVDPAELTAARPEKRVMECIVIEGGFLEPLAPARDEREPPSRSFAHGVGPGEGHIAIYLSTSPQEVDRWIRSYNRIGEYHATKTKDGRNLILLDVEGPQRDREVALRCIAAATR